MAMFVGCAFSIPAQADTLDLQTAPASLIKTCQVVKTVTASSKSKVWIPTKGGKKYHKNKKCSNMNKPKKVTLKYAKSHGFKACKRCY